MQLQGLDWFVIGIYGVITFILGIWYTKRASQGMEDYFIAGRSLPWWIAGTSLAATWFATDAPLATASLVRQHGIFGNWLWWYEAGGLMLLVFFFAKFWRRANILTDAEFMEMRYSGKSASVLRGVAAIYHGVLRNCVVMGWVMLAMVKFADVLLGWNAGFTLIVCGILAIIYTVASGLWGVVMTDMFQFVTGLFGSIILAGIVLYTNDGPSGMVDKIQALDDAPVGTLDILPQTAHLTPLEFASYMCLIFVLWSRSGHDGYSAQRLFASKNDKNAMYAAFLWGFLGVAVMTWPWVIVGLGSLITFPISEASAALAADPELAYPMMLAELMPVGLKGLLVASFLAAFMSTMDTHLCWGGSYLVNDIYKRFIKKDGTVKHYVVASRVSILVLAIFAGLTAYFMDSIERAWIYIIDLTAGMAVVWALRWYWWRVNAWAEISAMLTSLILANGMLIIGLLNGIGLGNNAFVETWSILYTEEYNLIRAVYILIITTIVWVIVALRTRPDDQSILEAFYKQVRPGGWWGPVAQKLPHIKTDLPGSKRWMGWIFGVLFIYGTLLGLGYIVIDKGTIAFIVLVVAAVAFYVTLKIFSKQNSDSVNET